MLGELYGELLFTQDIYMSVGARTYDTPYLNKNDSRMTPNTFLAASVQGLSGEGTQDSPQWRWGGGYFDEIKPRNENQFISMSEAAGAPRDLNRGVFAGGLNYKRGDLSLGAVDYYSEDIINIFYTEAKWGMPLSAGAVLRFALQYSNQQSVGDDLLTGSEFSAWQWGGKAEIDMGPVLLTLAATNARGDANMRSPWSGYPGYTSVQVEDFNRAGEDAWMVRAAYDVTQVQGLSTYVLYVGGSPPDTGGYGRGESDFNLQYQPKEGALKGWLFRLRYAYVQQNAPDDSNLQDLRVQVYYDLPLN
jgi:hypothetical protein